MLKMINLPSQTSQIFNLLSKGFFLSVNSLQLQRELFQVTQKSEMELTQYFQPLGFELQKGNGFYYFTSPSTNSKAEESIEQVVHFIEWLDFFKAYNPAFGPGQRFAINQIHDYCLENFSLKRKLNQLPLRGSQGRMIDKIRQLVRLLEKQGFVELENEADEVYRVLAAFSFLELWAEKIELI